MLSKRVAHQISFLKDLSRSSVKIKMKDLGKV